MEKSQVCAGGDTLIFACSGAADVGAVADQTARKMMKDGIGTMFCLAGIGGRVEPILKRTLAAKKVLAIDGCSLNCVKACLQQVGVRFAHLQLDEIGMAKGQTSPTEENVNKAAAKGEEKLA